jgi:PAS domain S-box-containing protein
MPQNTGLSRQQGMQQVIDKLPAVIFEYTVFLDGSRDFTYISPRCEEILGMSSEILLRGVFPMKNYIYHEDWDGFYQSSESSLAELNEWKWEGRVNGRDGIVWIEVRGVPARQGNGNIIWSGLITDISVRKELEHKQRETERQYRNLVEHLPMGVGIYANGKIMYANSFALKMMKVQTEGDFLGLDLMNFVHPDFRLIEQERLLEVMQGNTVPPLEQKYICLDGKEIDVEVTAYPYQYQDEPAVQFLIRDISEQKETKATMKKTETLFSQLFQDSPMAITMLDDKGNVVKINKGFEEMFGYSLKELKGNGLNQFIVPDELEAEGNDLNSLISAYQVVKIETVRKRKDQTLLTVIVYGVPVRMDDKTIGIFGVYVDITERKKVEEELKVRNTELDNFVYKVSHDLRAPLSSILGLVNLSRMPDNDDNPHMYIDLIGQKVEQLDNFINDVLSHSKNLKLDVKVAKVNFNNIIDQTFTNLSHMKGAGEIKKTITIDSDDFYSDPWRIAEIFRNLISNAIKYRNQKSTESAIEIKITINAQKCVVKFKDNGIGIDRNNLSHIFDMFFRASEQSDGSGLGLYIVKNAVDKMGGEVSVDSVLTVGTTFQISLPNLSQHR